MDKPGSIKKFAESLRKGRLPRVIGFDDAPFEKSSDDPVNICGVVCAGTRFEGMLWGEVTRDGNNATEVIGDILSASKFYPQLHLVLLDGIAVGGFNIVKLKTLSNRLHLPCIAVMRKKPDMRAIYRALENLPDSDARIAAIAEAGEVHERAGFIFQSAGCLADDAAQVLDRLTDRGKVPEALRLAHLIGAAIKTGESGSRA